MTTGPDATNSGPEHELGSLAEEAARLAEAVRAWTDHNISDGSAACRACPLCQLIAAMRDLSPETIDRIGDQVEGVVHTVRAVVDSFVDHRGDNDDVGAQETKLGDEEKGET